MENDHKPPDHHERRAEEGVSEAPRQGDKHANPNTADPQSQTYRKKKHPLDYAEFLLLILVLGATATAAYYTRNQWLTAQDTEKRQLRAYVFIDRNDSLVKGNDLERADLKIAIKNFGQTPAYDVEAFAWLGVLDWPLPLGMPFDIPGPPLFASKYVLAQGASAPGHVQTMWPLSPAEIDEFRGHGKRKLVVYGRISYNDAFREPHTTDFCYGFFIDPNIPEHAEDCNQHTNAN